MAATCLGTDLTAHYGEFVQVERSKKYGEFGANRTLVSVMPNEVDGGGAV